MLGASNLVTSVGVDIEMRMGGSELSGIPGLSLPDEAVVGQEVDSGVIVFSVKEATFKAANSIVERQMDFDEVILSWENERENWFFGIAQCGGMRFEVRCSLVVPRWIVSAALMLPER